MTGDPGSPAVRDDLVALVGYHSPSVDVEVRLNTNESPLPPPAAFRDALAAAVRGIEFNRYPDRGAAELRAAIAAHHGVDPGQVYAANGSNEVLQSLLLAYGGPGRRAALFEPTYTLHRHIARLTGTTVVAGGRTAAFAVDVGPALELVAAERPTLTFLCSPNNPTGTSEPPSTVEALLAAGRGLVVVDEAYGQFAPASALDLLRAGPPGSDRLVVVRTFSKTWSMAAMRLGYLVAPPEVVAACELVTLPYHLDAVTQIAGCLALDYADEMATRVATVAAERDRVAAALAAMPVETWPSDANFVLFRPLRRQASHVWADLVAASVLVRDCSTWPGLDGCLRVTIGLAGENDRFLAALGGCL